MGYSALQASYVSMMIAQKSNQGLKQVGRMHVVGARTRALASGVRRRSAAERWMDDLVAL